MQMFQLFFLCVRVKLFNAINFRLVDMLIERILVTGQMLDGSDSGCVYVVPIPKKSVYITTNANERGMVILPEIVIQLIGRDQIAFKHVRHGGIHKKTGDKHAPVDMALKTFHTMLDLKRFVNHMCFT